jgi:AcrR family transcriptional regulator
VRPVIASPENARSRRTRAAVLGAARELIERDGFDAVTMSDIAARAGVTRRGVYLHFATKSELLAALIDHTAGQAGLHASLQRVWDAPDSVAALTEWARHLARFHPHILEIDLAAEHERRHNADAAAHRQSVIEDQRAVCRRLIRWLLNEHRLARHWSERAAVDMLWALMSSAMMRALLIDCGWSTTTYAQRIGQLLHSTFVETPSPANTKGHYDPPTRRAR